MSYSKARKIFALYRRKEENNTCRGVGFYNDDNDYKDDRIKYKFCNDSFLTFKISRITPGK